MVEPVYPEIDFGAAPLEDFHDRMAELREQGKRVVPVRFIKDIAWIILRYDDVEAAYADEENLPAAAAYRRHSEPTMGRTLLAMEGEEHRVHRLLMSAAFKPAAIRRAVDSILLPTANELVDAFGERRALDLVAEFSHRFPFYVITRLLGIPDTHHAQLVDWVEGLFSFPWDPERGLRAKAEFTSYVSPLVEARRTDPGDDLISLLATAEAEGQRLTEEAIFSLIRLLFPAGADTTFLSIGSMMHAVLRDRALYRRLLDRPEDRPLAVEESLRLYGTVALQPRFTEKAIAIGGVDIPANSVLLFGTMPANRDPEVFDRPDTFDIDRNGARMLTFGKGVHFCLGSHLARAEMQVALNVLLDRLPGLRLLEPDETRIVSAVLRGPRNMQVAFDDVLPASAVHNGLRIGRNS